MPENFAERGAEYIKTHPDLNERLAAAHTDTQALTSKTFDISLNTLKSSSNTAGHVPRNNGTQYVDGQLAAADLSDGVIGSGSIVKATALQGTDANVLSSGTVSASTGVPLCTDANHGATTSGCAASGVTEAFFGDGNSSSENTTVSSTGRGQVFFANVRTLTRFFVSYSTQAVTCGANTPVYAVRDVTAGSNLTTINGQNSVATQDSGALSIAMPAGHTFIVYVSTIGSGCGTNPVVFTNAPYQ